MTLAETNYRRILRSQLEIRCRKNKRFSQNAFAKFLGLRPSRLTEILSGKQGLSLRWAREISKKLNFNYAEENHFCTLVLAEHSRSPVQRKAHSSLSRESALKKTEILSDDIFKIISQWHHFAILELLPLNAKNQDIEVLAAKLKISPSQVSEAVERLIKVGQLQRKKNGLLIPCKDVTLTTNDIPSEALRSFQQEVLEKAQKSLHEDSIMERDISSVFFAVDTGQLAELKTELRNLRDRFAARAISNEKKDSIYCLNLNFFRLDTVK